MDDMFNSALQNALSRRELDHRINFLLKRGKGLVRCVDDLLTDRL